MFKEEIWNVENLINSYFEGIFNGDIEKLKVCFHERAYLYGDINGDEYLKSVGDYLDGVANRQSPKQLGETLNMKIIGIEIMGNIASAKLHVPMLSYNYYDYLSLVKVDGEWRIVNKLFTHVH